MLVGIHSHYNPYLTVQGLELAMVLALSLFAACSTAGNCYKHETYICIFGEVQHSDRKKY